MNSAVRNISNAVSNAIGAIKNTLRDQVTSLVTACENEFGGDYMPDKIAKAISESVAAELGWKGRTATVRKSEVRAVIGAYPFLVEGIAEYERVTGNIGWHSMVKLARQLPLHNTTKAAVNACLKKGKGTEQTWQQKIGMGLGIIKNAKTTSRNVIAFRKELAKLCKQYKIKF